MTAVSFCPLFLLPKKVDKRNLNLTKKKEGRRPFGQCPSWVCGFRLRLELQFRLSRLGMFSRQSGQKLLSLGYFPAQNVRMQPVLYDGWPAVQQLRQAIESIMSCHALPVHKKRTNIPLGPDHRISDVRTDHVDFPKQLLITPSKLLWHQTPPL